ncbi:MAG: fasciclin domain-containing protein [Candidatus Cryptobacteroides sp.]
MNRKIIYTVLVSACIMASGCEDPFKDTMFKAYDESSIATTLAGNEDYSLYVEMLKEANVFNALNLGNTEYTCFAVKNDSLAAYMGRKGWGSVSDIPFDELDYFVRYHIIAGKKYSNSDLLLKLSTKTVSGDWLTAGLDLETELRYIDNGDGVRRSYIIDKDIAATNGVIHGLDYPLQPITESVWSLIDRNGRYSIFAEALEASGLSGWLDNTYVELEGQKVRENKTVFVVPDEVFAARDIDSFEALKSRFSSPDPSDENSALYQFIEYHLFDKLVGYSELTTFPDGYKSMIYYGCSAKKGFSILDAGGEITINPDSGEESFHISDTRRDIPAKNGYIHEIDNLGTLPQTMSHYIVVYEPTDKFEYNGISFYRQDMSSSSSVNRYYLNESEIIFPGVRWESIPESKAKVWYHSENVSRYLDYDAIHWDLGTIGWIEFDIPVIPLGKYRISAEKYNTSSNGGKYNGYFDNATIADNVVNFATGTNHGTWKTFTLTTEEKHTIRFSVADQAGTCGIDRFVFTPID